MGSSNSGPPIKSALQGRIRIDHGAGRLIVTDNNNVDKLLAGIDDDGNVRVKMSIDGVDVKSASASQLIFSSDNNLFTIVSSGTVVIPEESTTSSSNLISSVQVSHDLGYAPVVLAYSESADGGLTQLPFFGVFIGFAAVDTAPFSNRMPLNDYVTFESTPTHVEFGAYRTVRNPPEADSVGPYTIKYYILKETAETS